MNRVFLIGYMGCGKSTLVKKIARALGYLRLDTDALIELQQGQSIADIFAQHGEAHFRQLERECLHSITQEELVIATGGGMPCHHDNLNTMKTKGIVIYIELPLGMLVDRIWQGRSHRPLAQHPTKESLHQSTQERLTQRTPIYQQADIIFRPHQQSLTDVMIELRGRM